MHKAQKYKIFSFTRVYFILFTDKNRSFKYTFYEDGDSHDATNSVDYVQAKANHLAEITRYLKLPCADNINNLDQLRMFETIKLLYLKFNVIMPSEADVERLFSFGGLIMRPHRRHMSSDMFEKAIILKSNCYPHRNDQNEKI